MAGPAGGASGGFHPHLPHRGYTIAGKALGAVMWFFIFYRVRKDGPAKLLGRHGFNEYSYIKGYSSGNGHH